MLDSIPCLNPEVQWEELDSGVLMAVYKRDARGLKKLLVKLFHVPENAQVMLDETGTRVVRAVDGVRSVRALIAYVADEFKLSRKEAEVALLKYMEMLGQRRLVGFAVGPKTGEKA
jgi:Coenzyme PQQ synthesis protein D (PqqD)